MVGPSPSIWSEARWRSMAWRWGLSRTSRSGTPLVQDGPWVST